MPEYIDRDALIAEYDRVHKGPAGGARKLMAEALAADVAAVVRCKDCICYIAEDYHCRKHFALFAPDAYCSYAERKKYEKEPEGSEN